LFYGERTNADTQTEASAKIYGACVCRVKIVLRR